MRRLLLNLKKNIPFYNEYINDDIMNNDKECEMEIFQSLPIIDRAIIKENYDKFVIDAFPRDYLKRIIETAGDSSKDYQYNINGKEYWVEYTSGTTGSPLAMIKSTNERLRLGASVWKMRQKFSMVSPEQMFCFMHNKNGKYPFPFEFDKSNRASRKIRELQYLQDKGYKWWHIFPAQLEGYVEFETYFDNSCCGLEVIECNGAHISKHDIERFSEVFNCKIANNYGCRELWNIAYSCKNGKLHINDDNVIFELVDANGQIINEVNQIGEIVVSSKNLRTMPFIRYKMGDYGYYEDDNCNCGNNSRIINIDTKRNKILDTDLYGTDVFRSIMLDLSRVYNLKEFDSVNIVQYKIGEFEVNVKRCREDKNIFEDRFVKCANNVLGGNNKYIFQYDVSKKFKSIFVAI